MSESTDKHAGSRRSFYHFGRSFYADTLSAAASDDPYLDEIGIGMYADDGGTTGEFQLVWTMLAGKPVCKLVAFDDSWSALALFSKFLAKLASLDTSGRASMFSSGGPAPLPSQVLALLRECDTIDLTKTQSPRGAAVKRPPADAYDPLLRIH